MWLGIGRSAAYNPGLPKWLSGKESTCEYRRCWFDPWVGKIPGDENGNPIQHSCLENPMNRVAWWAAVHGVSESQTGLSSVSRHAQLTDQEKLSSVVSHE